MTSQRRQVLSEEDYTSTLSSIVQRDYFPELPGLQKQAAVLDQREARDFKGAVAVRRAARRLQDHEDLLAEQENEDEHDVDHGNLRKKARPLHRESVSGFHARATSEDNQEFEQNLKEEVQSRQRRIEAVYRNPYQQLTNGEEKPKKLGSETPLLASDMFNPPSQKIESPKNPKFDGGLFFSPDHQPSKHAQNSNETQLLTNRRSERDLMPPPAPKQKNSTVDGALVARQGLVEYVPKHALEKCIEPSQTRFPKALPIVPGPRHVQTADETTDYSTEASTDLDAPAPSLEKE